MSVRKGKHKRKRRCCGLCKPHKRGWVRGSKDRQHSLDKQHTIEARV